MKTYLVPIHGKLLSTGVTKAKNKDEAFKKVKARYPNARKTGIVISGWDISMIDFSKWKSYKKVK
jgi:hypothetical protein